MYYVLRQLFSVMIIDAFRLIKRFLDPKKVLVVFLTVGLLYSSYRGVMDIIAWLETPFKDTEVSFDIYKNIHDYLEEYSSVPEVGKEVKKYVKFMLEDGKITYEEYDNFKSRYMNTRKYSLNNEIGYYLKREIAKKVNLKLNKIKKDEDIMLEEFKKKNDN